MRNRCSDILFQAINYILFTIFCIICIYPFYYIFIYTVSDPIEAQTTGVYLYPIAFTLDNYLNMSRLGNVWGGAFISVSRAVIGTVVTLFFSSILAFVFTKKEMFLRKTLYRITVSALYISAGIIPYYMTMKLMGLKDSFLLYILPSAVIPYYLILIKTYFESIPDSIQESAVIDGANYFTIFIKMMVPLAKPIIAAIAVFSAVNQWNSWFDNFLLVKKANIQTLQLILLNYLREADGLSRQSNININDAKALRITPTSVRMTITMISVVPILCVYPFLQKYFVKGIMLGAVKG